MAQLNGTVLHVTPTEAQALVAARDGTTASKASQAFVLVQVLRRMLGNPHLTVRIVPHLHLVVDPLGAQRLLADAA